MTMATSDGEKIEYLTKHLAYERQMLGYTFSQLHSQGNQLAWNAHFESFCIHARNLYCFLNNRKGSATLRACDFSPAWAGRSNNQILQNMDTFIFHLSAGRLKRKRFDFGQVQAIGMWLDGQWASWANELQDPFNDLTDGKPACVNGEARPRIVSSMTTASSERLSDKLQLDHR